MNDSLSGDRRFDDLRYHIADFLDATDVLVEEAGLKVLAALDGAASRSNNRARLAIAVCDNRLIELASMYEAKSSEDGWDVEIFDTLEGAIVWAKR